MKITTLLTAAAELLRQVILNPRKSLMLLALIDASYATNTTTAAKPATEQGALRPYFDASLDSSWNQSIGALQMNVSAITQAQQLVGLDGVIMAFIVASNGNECAPSYGGFYPVEDSPYGDPIYTLNNTMSVTLSFGGAAGTYLQTACKDTDTLYKAINTVAQKFPGMGMDFDIEGAQLSDHGANARLATAVAKLQQQQPIPTSITLPVMPTGLTADGINVVKTFLSAKAKFVVNIMAMDFGSDITDMRAAIVSSFNSTRDQLKKLFPEKSATEVNAMLSVTPMIGNNDVAGETLTVPQGARAMKEINRQGSGWSSLWSLQRDMPCRTAHSDPNHCSGVEQQPLEFTRAFNNP